MARDLAIDLDGATLAAVARTAKGATLRIDSAGYDATFGTLSAVSAPELGKKFRAFLSEQRLAAGPLHVTLGRDRYVLKEIKFPSGVSAVEEASVVRFQAARDATEASDSIVLDYVVLPGVEPDGQRKALTFAVKRDILTTLKAFAQAAGLKLGTVSPRGFGVVAGLLQAQKMGAVPAPDSADAPLAIVTRSAASGELHVAKAGKLVFSRAMSAPALASETAFVGEIKRTLALFAANAGGTVQAVYVAEADTAGGWSGRLASGLSVPVHRYDPLAGVAELADTLRGSFAGLVAVPDETIDFLEPREPKPFVDPTRKLVGTVASLGILALVIAGGIGFLMLQSRSKQAAALLAEKNQLDDDLRKLEDSMKLVRLVDDWKSRSVNWFDEIYDLTARFPDPRSTRLTQFLGESREPEKNAPAKHVAKMTLNIVTESSQAIDRLQFDMNQEKNFRMSPKESKMGQGGSARFNQSYILRADIERRDPSGYIQKLTTSAPVIEAPAVVNPDDLFGGKP